ncbi:MAG: vWA domain-containing protein [Nitrososphaerales archaeon]
MDPHGEIEKKRNAPIIQKTETRRGQVIPVDSVFVLDCSRSMGDPLESNSKSAKIDLAKTAIVSAFSRAAENACPDRIGLLTVSTNIFAKPIIKEVVTFGEISSQDASGKGLPIEDIVSIKCQGGTALYAAISYATKILVTKKGSRTNDQQIVILTDSKNNTAEQPMKVLSEAAKNRIKIHVIDLGNLKVKDSLKMISDATGGQFALATNAKEIHSNLFAAFTPPQVESAKPESRGTILLPDMFADQVKPPVTPKRRKPETVEEISSSIDQIKGELISLTDSLKSGKKTQMQFTERYSILQFELQDLRQAIREQRSKLNREMSEYALVQDKISKDSLNEEANNRLMELDRQIQILKQSATFVS